MSVHPTTEGNNAEIWKVGSQLNQQDARKAQNGKTCVHNLSCDQGRIDNYEYHITRHLQDSQGFKIPLRKGPLEIQEARQCQMYNELGALKKNKKYVASEATFVKRSREKKVQMEHDELIALHYQLNRREICDVLEGKKDFSFFSSDQSKIDYAIGRILIDNKKRIQGFASTTSDLRESMTVATIKKQKKNESAKETVKGNSFDVNNKLSLKSSFRGKVKHDAGFKQYVKKGDLQGTYDNLMNKMVLILKEIDDLEFEEQILLSLKEAKSLLDVNSQLSVVKDRKRSLKK